MPDYCLCKGGLCPQKQSCARFRAEPNPYRQSYFAVPPFDRNDCEHYWNIAEGVPFRLRKEGDDELEKAKE